MSTKIARIIRTALVCAGLACLALALTGPAFAEEVHWGEDLSAAFKNAEKSGQPVLVDVWAVWCVPCKHMDETTYRDPNIVALSKKFQTVKVDADLQKVFIERYRIDAYPTVLVLDGKGNEITRLMGLIGTEDMRRTLDAALAGYPRYLEIHREKSDPAKLVELARYFGAVGNPAEAASRLKRSLKKMKGASPAERAPLELDLARALVADEDFSAAAKLLRKLTSAEADPALRGEALVALYRAESGRGKEEAAANVRTQLESEYPELAKEL